jgi:hypothetical protein
MTPDTEQELRVACAEAMGWTYCEDGVGKALAKLYPDQMREPKCDSGSTHTKVIPDFSTDPNAALALVDALAEKGWRYNIEGGKGFIFVTFYKKVSQLHPQIGGTFQVTADTRQLAICRAFLAVHQSTL